MPLTGGQGHVLSEHGHVLYVASMRVLTCNVVAVLLKLFDGLRSSPCMDRPGDHGVASRARADARLAIGGGAPARKACGGLDEHIHRAGSTGHGANAG